MKNEPSAHRSRTVSSRTARNVAVLTTWSIWIGALVGEFVRLFPPYVAAILAFAGFAPYIVSIKVVEPWLGRRDRIAQ
jgi:hypothetical protein